MVSKFVCVFENGEVSCLDKDTFEMLKEGCLYEGNNEWDEDREGITEVWGKGEIFKLIELRF